MKTTYSLGFMAAMALAGLTAHAASSVTGIDFKSSDSSSRLEIKVDGPVEVTKSEIPGDQQAVIEIKGAKLSPSAKRPLDTSSFNSRISLVSPYQAEGQEDVVRVVLQMRALAEVEVSQQDGTVTVVIPEAATAAGNDPVPGEDPAPIPAAPVAAESEPSAEAAPFAQGGDERRLEQFLENQTTKTFTGKHINLNVVNAPVQDVLRLIGDTSGFNIVIGEDVKGAITLALNEVPWDQALDLVLHTLRLGAERNRNVLRVVTLESLTAEKRQELDAKRAAQQSAPRITRVFPISFADLGKLPNLLTATTAPVGGGGSDSASSSNANISVDDRTSSLIVQAIPEELERIRKLVELLDVQTPQVLVETKVVEASEEFSRAIGGNIGFGSGANATNPFFVSFNGANPINSLLGGSGVLSGSDIAGGSAGQGTFGFSPSLGFLPGLGTLNAVLSIGENESKLKVVTSPRVVVLNRETATISQTEPLIVTRVVSNLGVTTVSQESIDAEIKLEVTPTVTNEGAIQLELTMNRGVPKSSDAGNAIANREMKTKVLVEGGSTLVIGGIYTNTDIHSSSGFPFLRKIPIIGALFGRESNSNSHTELMFFVTPRVLNPKEAGLSS